MDTVSKDVVDKCKNKLLETRQELMNHLQEHRSDFTEHLEGDEGDMAQVLQNQDASIIQREQSLVKLRQIEIALQKIENGTYGFCEETEEVIEPDRLLAIPWTPLSIDGAEARERRARRTG